MRERERLSGREEQDLTQWLMKRGARERERDTLVCVEGGPVRLCHVGLCLFFPSGVPCSWHGAVEWGLRWTIS